MTKEERDLLAYINARPVILDLLWDLNLMPEQHVGVGPTRERWRMLRIAQAFRTHETALTTRRVRRRR